MGKSYLANVTDDEFTLIVNNSSSIKEIMRALGYKNTPYQYAGKAIKARMDKLNLTLDKTNAYDFLRVPDEEMYCKGSLRGGLRKRVLKDNFMPYACDICSNTGEWEGKPLTLQLDHIDGDATNNEKSNLRWLCPNCHTQTETYGSKNKDSKRKDRFREESLCQHCNQKYVRRSRTQRFCSNKCAGLAKKKTLPVTKDELIKEITSNGFLATGKKYGVSDNAIRKWCKRYGISPKASDYKK